jgi:hypothetical protein
MDPEVLLQISQEPSSDPYSKPVESIHIQITFL